MIENHSILILPYQGRLFALLADEDGDDVFLHGIVVCPPELDTQEKVNEGERMIYLTEVRKEGRLRTGEIHAPCWEEAQRICGPEEVLRGRQPVNKFNKARDREDYFEKE